MKVVETALPGVLVIEPEVHGDDRGHFLETFHAERYRRAGVAGPFVQDNQSLSRRGTLRGLHAQLEHPQGKLMRAVTGRIFDVAADPRPGSPTFGRWVGAELSGDDCRQLWVPPGYLHGFCVLSDEAIVAYKCTERYHPGDEIGVVWNDPELAIEWPVGEPLLSAKDAALPRLGHVAGRWAGEGGGSGS